MKIFGCLWAPLLFVLTCVLSWWIVYGLLYLIFWCFEWTFFSWRIVLGVWLLMWLIGGLFK